MSNKDLCITFTVDQSASEVFSAINNVSQWWTENIKGKSHALNDSFTVQFEDIHLSTQKLIEIVPDKKVVWQVTDSDLSFLKKRDEWTGTTIVFEIVPQGNQTTLVFTHIGLTPVIECFKDCSNGWNYYINSLFKLITTGEGHADKKVAEVQA